MLVICNGMLRSGSTLQYNIARLLVDLSGVGAGEGYFAETTPGKISSKMHQWGSSEKLHVVKTHELYPEAETMMGDGRAKICYIHRDIRDVAASARRKFNHEWNYLLSLLDSSIATYYRLRKMDQVLWQKYEMVVADISTSTMEMAHFLNISPARNIVTAIASECSIDNIESVAKSWENNISYRLKENFRKLCFLKPLLVKSGVPKGILEKISRAMLPHDGKTLLHADHISSTRGDSGVWKSIFDEKEQDILTCRYHQWLNDAGYL